LSIFKLIAPIIQDYDDLEGKIHRLLLNSSPGIFYCGANYPGSGLDDLALNDGIKGRYQKNKVDNYVKAVDIGAKINLLYDPIMKNAKVKNVVGTEALREKSFATDALALTEIIRSGEIIEEEKTDAIDKNHMEIWSKLYDILTSEEANALYDSLKEENIDADVTLFEEGKPNSRLFFINMGDLKMVYSTGDKKTLLKKFSTGEIVGEDTFFNISHCTTSVITLSRVQLHMLEETALNKLEKDFPKLRAKLRGYCLKLEHVPDVLKKKNLDRRTQKRYRINGPVFFQLVTKFGERMGRSFKGSRHSTALRSFGISASNRIFSFVGRIDT
jgi:CRP-like cAMP-binding protein